jgi:periplasmic iron binding protein
MLNTSREISCIAAASLMIAAGCLQAGEHPIGDPVEKNGMEIAAVYLQPVMMEPMLPGMMEPTDIHLEADIHAAKGNQNGFGEGEWVPYLGITYQISKVGGDWSTGGAFMPMVASDGPHYGENIKLDGPGKYLVRYRIAPPPINGFYRHTDKETGVGEWWMPFDLEWEFIYAGAGKKGGY